MHLSDKWAMVTGATDGIGRETALGIAQAGYHLLVHGRTPEKADAAVASLRSRLAHGQLTAVSGDLSSLRQVRVLADQVRAITPQLDILVNNAGIKTQERMITEDGFEATFAVNHLAPFLLTNLLVPELRVPTRSRVVTVSSISHYRGRIHWDDLQLEYCWDSYRAYAQSKLANVLFAYALAQRLTGTGVTSNALHPGVVATKLLAQGFGSSGTGVEAGAAASLTLALDPRLFAITACFYSDGEFVEPSPLALRIDWQERLWSISSRLVGLS